MKHLWLAHPNTQQVMSVQAQMRGDGLMQFAPLLLLRSCTLHREGLKLCRWSCSVSMLNPAVELFVVNSSGGATHISTVKLEKKRLRGWAGDNVSSRPRARQFGGDGVTSNTWLSQDQLCNRLKMSARTVSASSRKTIPPLASRL